MPEGFCPIAWNQSFWANMVLSMGGTFPWCLPPDLNKVTECCPEGLRPVIFLFERIEE